MIAKKILRAITAVLLTASTADFLPAQQTPAAPASPSVLTYADMADLVISSPLIVNVTIRSATRIKGPEAATVAPGHMRFYMEADVSALIRGPGAIPPRIGYLLDAQVDSSGRMPHYKRAQVLLFARTVAGRADQVQLIRPGAQYAWNPTLDALARRVTQEVLASDAPPIITGIGSAFHVPGSLPGEGETQVFLTTADRRPVSLSVLRRPGEEPRWAVALSEIVDDSAAPPKPDTLLWYRLACALPPEMPARSTASLSPDDATKAQEDYRFVIARLGRCARDVTSSATINGDDVQG